MIPLKVAFGTRLCGGLPARIGDVHAALLRFSRDNRSRSTPTSSIHRSGAPKPPEIMRGLMIRASATARRVRVIRIMVGIQPQLELPRETATPAGLPTSSCISAREWSYRR